MTEPSSLFLRACRGLPTERTPIWLMRQAGRYMAEYRAVRAKHSMLEVIATPELATEVTLQPIDTFGFDAAIIFSDILPPLIGMGFNLDYLKGDGPKIFNPIESAADVARLTSTPSSETMAGTLAAITMTANELASRGVPLIGFAGAPFTLASYVVEGGGTSSYAKVKSFMYTEPDAWHDLMGRLVAMLSEYLHAQVKAGAVALQGFDSWAGLALGKRDYERFVQPHNVALMESLSSSGVPVINFSTGTAAYIEQVAACGGDVIGIDWRMPIDWVWERIGYDKPVQGNLDPVALLAPWESLQADVDDVLSRAANRTGHIFNLGHGVLPPTAVDNVRRLVEYVKEKTAR